MSKTSLGSIRGLKFKMNLEILMSCLREEVALKVLSPLVSLVEIGTMGNFLWVPEVVVVVVKMVIK